jgi:hypothetical protein
MIAFDLGRPLTAVFDSVRALLTAAACELRRDLRVRLVEAFAAGYDPSAFTVEHRHLLARGLGWDPWRLTAEQHRTLDLLEPAVCTIAAQLAAETADRIVAAAVDELVGPIDDLDEEDDTWDAESAAAGIGWQRSRERDPNHPLERDLGKDLCRICGETRTREGHDPCIARLPGVRSACCGHGRSGELVYVDDLHGPAAAERMRALGGHPPAAAFLEVEESAAA